jgi:hypothetical protein
VVLRTGILGLCLLLAGVTAPRASFMAQPANSRVSFVAIANGSPNCAWITIYGDEGGIFDTFQILTGGDAGPRWLPADGKQSMFQGGGLNRAFESLRIRAEIVASRDCRNTAKINDVSTTITLPSRGYYEQLYISINEKNGAYWLQTIPTFQTAPAFR